MQREIIQLQIVFTL